MEDPAMPENDTSTQGHLPAASFQQGLRRNRALLVVLSLVILIGLVLGGIVLYPRLSGGAAHRTGTITISPMTAHGFHDFAVPTANSKPFDITRGPDGNLWFTEFDGNKIGRVTPVGAVTEFALSDPNSSAAGITAGPDGNLWVTAYPGEIYRVTPNGSMTMFTLPTTPTVPFAITAGPDGNLWFSFDAEFTSQNTQNDNLLGSITPSGKVSTLSLPTKSSNVDAITLGPDGNLWFTDYGNDLIGSVSPGGSIHEYANHAPYNSLNDLARGPDGALWYTEQDGVIGRITRTGAITKFTIPTPNSQPNGITAGPGNTIWFTELGANRIGYVVV